MIPRTNDQRRNPTPTGHRRSPGTIPEDDKEQEMRADDRHNPNEDPHPDAGPCELRPLTPWGLLLYRPIWVWDDLKYRIRFGRWPNVNEGEHNRNKRLDRFPLWVLVIVFAPLAGIAHVLLALNNPDRPAPEGGVNDTPHQ
jgi:hypothetical protein